jgi:hypothetical protein
VIFLFNAPVWVWDARKTDVWTFVSLPAEASEEIRDFAGDIPRGFGAVKVTVTIGATTWRTSIFPMKGGSYVLPLKKAVRTAEGLAIDAVATVKVELDV